MNSMQYREPLYAAYLQSTACAAHDIRMPYLKSIVRRHFPTNKNIKILDLGCGSGAMMRAVKEMGYFFVRGVDVSPSQVQAAEQLGISEVEQGDVFETLHAQADASLDLIIAFDVIEHLSKNETVLFMQEIRRILSPSGHCLLHTVNAESPFFGRIRYGDYTHEQAFSQQSLSQLVFALGFSKIKTYEDQPVVHGLKSFIRWGAWKIIRSCMAAYLMIETGERGGLFSQNMLAVVTK